MNNNMKWHVTLQVAACQYVDDVFLDYNNWICAF